MDKTSEYILQCEKAEEIQKNWKPSRGDWYIYKHDFKDHTVQIIGSEYQYAYSADFIWLPRQDDLQEIYLQWVNRRELRQTAPMALQFFATFVHNETRTIKSSKITSLEQLWLSFVMKECFNKVWSIEGEEWIATGGVN